MDEMTEMTLMEYEENLDKIYNRYLDNLLMIRVGRANPKLIENPFPIPLFTYEEMRELSYAGFSVLHEEALAPVFPSSAKRSTSSVIPSRVSAHVVVCMFVCLFVLL